MKRWRYIDGIELFDLIISRENILLAIKNACRDHAKDPDVIRMKADPGAYVDPIIECIKDGHFKYSRFITKDIMERGKLRHLCYSRTFPDRVVQHAVLQVVAPLLNSTCTADTYAAQEGRGTHKCSMAVRKAIKNDPENTRYYLKTDIKKYFDSIDREVLFNLIKRKIRCPRTLCILHDLIFNVPGRKGLAIGLYLSQVLAVFMLSYFMHYVKEVLHAKHAFLYMDDLVIFSSSKIILHRTRKAIDDTLRTRYHLGLKKNWCIRPIAVGLDFVGYVHYPTHTLLRKCNKIRFLRACRSVIHNVVKGNTLSYHQVARLESYRSMVGWCDGRHLHRAFGRTMAILARLGGHLDISYRARTFIAHRLDDADTRISQMPNL